MSFNSPSTDKGFFGLWSFTHMVFGGAFFLILYKYFRLSMLYTIIVLFIIHYIYEWKDIHLTYDIYENHPGKIKAAKNVLASSPHSNAKWFKIGIRPGFHMPPNTYINSIGDTIFYIAGVALAYFFRDNISPLFMKILIWFSVLYWIQVAITYYYVTSLGLHNKKRVNEIYYNSLMLQNN